MGSYNWVISNVTIVLPHIGGLMTPLNIPTHEPPSSPYIGTLGPKYILFGYMDPGGLLCHADCRLPSRAHAALKLRQTTNLGIPKPTVLAALPDN